MKALRNCILYLSLIFLLINSSIFQAKASNEVKSKNLTTYSSGFKSNILPADFEVFFNLLSPYGAWVEYRSYGYCWIPRLGVEFTPYCTNGHWVYTDEGWTWYSDYSWGWAPFHYGRWLFDDDYGWIWIPGHEWAPAWVVWGHYGGYYGWAPVGPGVTISIGYRPPLRWWTFVPEHRFGDVRFHRYIVHDRSIVYGNINVIYNSHSYRNVVYNRGPYVTDIEKITHRSYKPVPVKDFDHPLSGRESHMTHKEVKHGRNVPVYRPDIEHKPDFRGAPGKVEKIDNFRRNNHIDNGGGRNLNHQQNGIRGGRGENNSNRKHERNR